MGSLGAMVSCCRVTLWLRVHVAKIPLAQRIYP